MGIASINFDATLQTVFMIMFFTTVGFTVSIPALLKGSKAVILVPCHLHCDDPAAKLPWRRRDGALRARSAARYRLRLHRSGRRPCTAAAFGPDLEAAGVVGGSVVSIAAATFGLVAGSLMGGRRPSVSSKSTICVPLR